MYVCMYTQTVHFMTTSRENTPNCVDLKTQFDGVRLAIVPYDMAIDVDLEFKGTRIFPLSFHRC